MTVLRREVGEAATVVDDDAFVAAWRKAKSAGAPLPTSLFHGA